MKIAEIKTELHQKIDSVDSEQLKQIYGLINNYISGNGSEEWNALTEIQRARILKGLKEADAGIGNSLITINQRLRAKYGIND